MSLALRPLFRTDWKAVAALLREIWPEIDFEHRMRRQWAENPDAPADGCGWVAHVDGELAGFFGAIPLAYRVAGRRGLASAATTLYVRPPFRHAGLGRRLVEAWANAPDVDLFVNATPNAASDRLFRRLGFGVANLGPQAWRGAAAVRPFADAWRSARERVPVWLAPALVAPLGVHAAWRHRGLVRRTSHGEPFARRDRSPAFFEAAWDAWGASHATTLWRDARQVDWLFFSGRDAARNAVFGRDGERGPLWAAFREEPERSTLRQVDRFGPFDAAALDALVDAVAAHARAQRLARVRLTAFDAQEAAVLARRGLYGAACRDTIFWRSPAPLAEPPAFGELDGDRCLNVLL